MPPIKIAVVGVGKIARDQHLPVLRASDAFELVAAVSRHGPVDDLPTYADLPALLAGEPQVEAVALCTPPLGRHELAYAALQHGCHVLLEKPPGATVSEVADLVRLAQGRNLALFATWHSREAPAVTQAAKLLEGQQARRVEMVWKEDVRRWHPGQDWIWREGGLGVFDPGINGLSILTRILPGAYVLTGADLDIPENCAAPIGARLTLIAPGGAPVAAELDWRETGDQTWDITVETDRAHVRLSHGGARLHVDGETLVDQPETEYANLYARFAELVGSLTIEVDASPLQLVADAFLIGRRHRVEPFFDV